MKQKLLFIIPSLDSGGGEKSLINLLNALDFNQYEVTIKLFAKKGLFLQLVPSHVKITQISGNYTWFSKGILKSVFYFLKNLKFNLILNRIVFAYKNAIQKNAAIAEQNSWINKSKFISNEKETYDVAIAFLEKSSIYYVVEKVTANKKIGWIHTNYKNSGLNPIFDEKYFKKLDAIVTVSDECKQSLNQFFPQLKFKIKVIQNIVSSKTVIQLSNQSIDDLNYKTHQNSIITVARLSHEKGIDIAIETAKILKSKIDFKWYVIGGGNERNNLQQLVKSYELQNNFIFLGLKSNPYPYIKQSSLYVQPSRYEGKSIAIDEAKILAKPILTTDYPTAKDQIENDITGKIVHNNPELIANEIMCLFENEKLKNQLSENLLNLKNETEYIEIEKFNNLIHE